MKKKWFIGLIIIIFVAVLYVINTNIDLFQSKDEMKAIENDVVEDNKDESDEEEFATNIAIIDVKGEVKNPGVYEMNIEDRVHEVIERAGGFTKDADETAVNLAEKIYDEMIIYVPSDGEEFVSDAYDMKHDKKININQATQEEIEQLDGIGPGKASAIIEYREEHGRFESVEDLLNVRGIGEKTLDGIEDDIHVP